MIHIRLQSRETTRYLFTILGVLLALHLWVAFCHLVLHWKVEALTQLVDVDLEANLPTFFNVALFFIAAMLFYLHGKAEQGAHRRGWFVMAVAFCFLGIDEGSQIHEKFMMFTLRLMNHGKQDGGDLGWFYYAWVIPYGLATIALVVTLGGWLFKIRPELRKGLVISGTIYVFGAIFLEMAGGKLARTLPFQDASNFPWLPCNIYDDPGSCWLYMEPRYIILYTLEETCEMTGLILCIGALLKAFEAKQLQVGITVGERPGP
ncbi:MAG: hypothetical protein JST38_19840 [Bacteroidetes bacterium]|nr:hypothetical protein [Bacteroidota bacterium]MBS1943122.1 hypothetical protein [Bacteroidota bacterium]